MKVARSTLAAVFEMENETEGEMFDDEETEVEDDYDFYVAYEMEQWDQCMRQAMIEARYTYTSEEMTIDQHYTALCRMDVTGEMWRVYSQRVSYDTRPLTYRREPVPQGAFSRFE